ncbi:ABC transporter ATP-binding protein [Paraburkholderia kururiensis]|uniref:ABC transporter ATP-binding protein n=1 Tax=Paraburkholderia kururiensis TaxID=984307 RepID=A0ABZ0WM99_9BURK|nr:ABC transporter ATP-binding protein [Paraburkholderia kururiensis]WQD78423.1 ABC transporter ATP-binding protein [Paraburkholderia kururiensis]
MPPTSTLSDSLDIQHVGKRYVQRDSALTILDDISLHVRAGEFVSIVGPSGCGKSTLLRLIAGLDTDYVGEIRAGAEMVRGTSLERGIVFQDHRLFPWLTVEQNVATALRNARLSMREKRTAVAAHLELVGLSDFAQSWPHQLSGGMAQRVAIARGLVNRPRVLLLDEPFGALDAQTRARMQNELQRIWAQERITMILVTHDVEEAIWLSDRVVTLDTRPGRIRRVVDVELPRPRRRDSPAFVGLRQSVLADLGDPADVGDETLLVSPAVPVDQWKLAW